jgi:hypothetical protein
MTNIKNPNPDGQEREALEQIEKMSSLCGGLSWPKALERLTAVRDRARAALTAREITAREDALATNRPEMDWIAATEIQRLAEEDPLAYPRGTAPAMAHLIERDRQRFGYGSKERS